MTIELAEVEEFSKSGRYGKDCNKQEKTLKTELLLGCF
jgi:hypothetical protein